MEFTKNQMMVLGGLLLIGYLAFCAFGYVARIVVEPVAQPPAVVVAATTQAAATLPQTIATKIVSIAKSGPTITGDEIANHCQTLTELQVDEYLQSLNGQTVAFEGKIENVTTYGIRLDAINGNHTFVLLRVPRDQALQLEQGVVVRGTATIADVAYVISNTFWTLELTDVVIE